MKYTFEIWANMLKVVEVEATNEKEAREKIFAMVDNIDFSDAEEIGEREIAET